MKRKQTPPYTDIRTRRVQKDGFLYTYTLLCTEEVCPIYSIGIRLLTPEHEETTATLAQPIFDGGRAAVLFETLSENLVTPIDLPYVIEDMLDL
jgi:hypothetical protein